jgi:hypothetical protein
VERAAPIHRRPGLTLYRLVAKEAITPTFFALFGLTENTLYVADNCVAEPFGKFENNVTNESITENYLGFAFW